MRFLSRTSASLAAVALVAVAALYPTPAPADGALYVAVPKKGLRDGFAFGYVYNIATPQEAQKQAREVCEKEARAVNIRVGACQLIEAFKKRCVAVAMDPDNRWAGWATGDTKTDAERMAVAKCGEGATACKLHDSACDE